MRADMATEAPRSHGGRREAALRHFPMAPLPLIDLSTGINPIPYPIGRLSRACFTDLPEPEAVERLQAVAAQCYGAADPAMIVAAPGTQIMIDLLPLLFPQRSVAILGATYHEHEAAWTRAGSRVSMIGSLDEMTDQQTLVLCNPNNPDGRTHAPAALRMMAPSRGLLVVDEAFADFVPELSMVPGLAAPGTIVLRSFGKSYGLAGVRLGFAIATPAIAAVIRAALGPWAVSGPAIAIATRALADRSWHDRARRRLARDAARLDAILTGAGLTLVGGTSLFRLAATPVASAWFDQFGRAGIMVRRFDDQPTWLRFGIPGRPRDWLRLAEACSRTPT